MTNTEDKIFTLFLTIIPIYAVIYFILNFKMKIFYCVEFKQGKSLPSLQNIKIYMPEIIT